LIRYNQKKRKSPLGLISLKYALEDRLNKKVDILTYKSINHLLKKEILDSEVKIL
jgi:predicted nucleotidyltransferase